jgi:hypothetical protein
VLTQSPGGANPTAQFREIVNQNLGALKQP